MEGGAPPPRARTGSVFVDENDDVRLIIAQLRAAVSAGEVIPASTLDSLVEALNRGAAFSSERAEARKAAKMSALVNTQELAELAERVAGVRVIALEVLDGLQKAETACACDDKLCDECGGAPFPTDTWLQAVQLCERIKSVFTEQGLLDCEGGIYKEKRVVMSKEMGIQFFSEEGLEGEVCAAAVGGGGGGGGGGPDLRWRYVMPKGEGEKIKLRTAKGVAPDVLLDVADFEDLSKGPFNMCIAAGTNSGKSYLMAGIALKLVEEQRVNDVFILSADPDTVKEADSPYREVGVAVMSDAVKGKYKVYSWSEETLAGIVKWQVGRRNDGTIQPILIILDDVDNVVRIFYTLSSFSLAANVFRTPFRRKRVPRSLPFLCVGATSKCTSPSFPRPPTARLRPPSRPTRALSSSARSRPLCAATLSNPSL